MDSKVRSTQPWQMAQMATNQVGSHPKGLIKAQELKVKDLANLPAVPTTPCVRKIKSRDRVMCSFLNTTLT